MSLSIASLNSGSNGNCYFVGNEQEAVLIDVGITCREVEKRMKRLGLEISKLKALFITHEHGDHITGVSKLSKKYKLPVHISTGTLGNSTIIVSEELLKPIAAYEPIKVGALTVTPFPKYHDAADPHSFIVSNEVVKVGVFTDIGYACRHVRHHFRQCHAAFLESNYDVEMLATGPYPPILQNRIRNGYGHLSNLQARKLFVEHRPPFMSHLILSHLSRNNNKPSIVESMFAEVAGDTEIIVASRNQESKLITVEASRNSNKVSTKYPVEHAKQLSLF